MINRRVVAVALAASLLLSGCWSRREVNDLGVVIALGVDRVDSDQLEVTLSIALPGAATSGKAQPGPNRRPRVIIKRQGRTIADAIRTAELSSPRRLRLDHATVILVGEHLGQEGFDHLIDFLMRSPQVRMSARISMVSGTTPAELLSLEPLMRTTQAEALRELETGRAVLAVKLKDFFIARAHAYMSPIVSTIGLHQHAADEQGSPDQEAEFNGAAVFREDRVAVRLDRAETRAAYWLLSTPRDAVITGPCPGGGPGNVSAQVAEVSRKMVPTWNGRRFAFRVTFKGSLTITDLQCIARVSQTEQVDALQEVLRKRLTESVGGVIRKLQANRVDPFAFGDMVRAKFPAQWAQLGDARWLDTWADADVTVDAQVRVQHVNMTTEPPILIRPAGSGPG